MIDYVAEERKSIDLRREVRLTNRVALITLALLIIIPAILTYRGGVRVSNLRAVGSTVLCPGDKLEVMYTLRASGAGVLVRDWTTWSIDPPSTKIFSTAERFIVEEKLEQHIKHAWSVPGQYLNAETDEMEPMPAGKYRRILAVSSPSRSSAMSKAGVDFEILPGCPRQGD